MGRVGDLLGHPLRPRPAPCTPPAGTSPPSTSIGPPATGSATATCVPPSSTSATTGSTRASPSPARTTSVSAAVRTGAARSVAGSTTASSPRSPSSRRRRREARMEGVLVVVPHPDRRVPRAPRVHPRASTVSAMREVATVIVSSPVDGTVRRRSAGPRRRLATPVVELHRPQGRVGRGQGSTEAGRTTGHRRPGRGSDGVPLDAAREKDDQQHDRHDQEDPQKPAHLLEVPDPLTFTRAGPGRPGFSSSHRCAGSNCWADGVLFLL